jgi:catechol 2,3-dioxygenase-like lactoylglutathione lyase family enzyme
MSVSSGSATGSAQGGPALADMPALAGIHHLKLPVTDLARSLEWYQSRLGYQLQTEFVEQGQLMGYAMRHPGGGPDLALRLDPARARAAAGFNYFAIGVPDRAAMVQLAARLDALGQAHAGVHEASFGWILPEVADPDGHPLRFYTMEHHTDPPAAAVATVRDPRESAERRERERRQQQR